MGLVVTVDEEKGQVSVTSGEKLVALSTIDNVKKGLEKQLQLIAGDYLK